MQGNLMESQYYQPPAHHEHDLALMKWGLVVFLAVLVVIVGLIVYFAPVIAKAIPFSAEQRFVAPYEKIIKKMAPESSEKSKELSAYLQTQVDALAKTMDMPSDMTVKVHVLNSATPNAFVVLGGHMFVFTGLLDTVEDENSLSMVLAHELAHIKHRDPLVAMGRGFALSMLYAFITGNYGGSDVLTLGGDLSAAAFSRDQEASADVAALHAINAHYGHVAGFSRFFEKAKAMEEQQDLTASQKTLMEWLSTHPELQERIDNLKAIIDREGWHEDEVKLMPERVYELLEGRSFDNEEDL